MPFQWSFKLCIPAEQKEIAVQLCESKQRRFSLHIKNPECFRIRDFGSPCWTRTNDLRINSPSLYRLS